MSLKPGKKYLVDGTKEKITKRNQGDSGKVVTSVLGQAYYYPRIDYVQDAEEDNEFSGYPKSQLTTKGTIGEPRYGHDKIPFFGANRVTYDDVKYNEVYQTIANDEIYQISSNAQIKWNGNTYNHGDVFRVNPGTPTSFEIIRGNPLLMRIEHTIGAQEGEPTQDDYYFVYGTSDDAYEHGIKYNNKIYYPGDVFIKGTPSGYETYVPGSGDPAEYGYWSNNVSDAVLLRLDRLNNPNLNNSSLVVDGVYLVYGYSNAFYNGYSLRPEILLKNIFKTGSSIDFSWDANTTDRKYPTIREIVKSDGIQRGIEYYIARDREINTEESHIKYDESFFTTRSDGTSFAGKNNTENYFVPSKQVDTTNDNRDTEDPTLISPFDSDIERFGGNPFVIRKEPIGLRKGQDYILVSEGVDSITDGKIYLVRGTGSVVYDGVTIENGEFFKGTAQSLFSVVGAANVFPLVNEITLEGGVAANTTIKINGGTAVAYTDSLLKTSYGQKGLRFNIASCDSPVMYWEKKTDSHGVPRVYPIVTTFNNDAAVYVHADGQGSVRYPSANLYYLCEGIGLRPSDYGRKTKLEVEAEDSEVTACTEAGGEWVPQRVGHHLSTRDYYNLDSFNATGGSCDIPLYNRDEAACIANEGNWTFDASADVFDDRLFTYRTHIGSDEQNYPFTVTATNSAHGSDGSPPNQPAANQIEVSALKYPLRANDCISFGEDSNGNYPLFVVDEYDYEVGDTVIGGRLLYGDIINDSVGTVSIKPSTNNTNPYEHYYVEDLEVKAAAGASVGASTITVESTVVDIKSGTLLKFTDNGVFVAEFKVSSDEEKGSTELEGNLRVGDLSTGYVAKLPPKVVGDLSINRQFSKKQRFKGIPNFNVIRAYNYKTLDNSLPPVPNPSGTLPNTQANIDAWKKIKVYDVFNVKDDLAAGTYKVGGGGYVKYKDEIYHGEGQGRVVVNHESNVDGELDNADSDELLQKGAYYEGVGSIKVEPLPSIIPEGTEIVFPNGVFRLSENADAGDTEITGEILADYMENFIYSTIWHKDKSFYYKIEGKTITGDGGTYSKVDKDGNEVFNADLFVYNSTAKDWVDGEELNPESPPYTNRKIIKITGADRKEYYMEAAPTEVEKTKLEENRTYEVQADGSFVEINRQLTNGEVEMGSAFVVGGNVYKTEEERKFNGASTPTRDGGVPEFIVYNEKPFIPGEVFTAVEGETHWVEVTIDGTPTETDTDSGIWKVPVSSLNAAIPVEPKLRREEDRDTIWTPEADLNDNELIPLFGQWDETEEEWYDREVFVADNLTSEGVKIYVNLKLRFGNGAVGIVQEADVSWGTEKAKYNADKKIYEKESTEIFLKLLSGTFKNGEVGKTGSGSPNSGIIFGGYGSGDGLEMKVKALPHALEVGTELVFYPAHPFRQFRALVEEERVEETQYPTDWWSPQAGSRRFTLTQQADVGNTTITGNLKASYNTGTEAFEGVGFKARAEIFREIVYNDKVVMAGGSFTCRKDVIGLGEDREDRIITTWKDSQNSKLGIKNSTGAEKVISYDDFIDYYEERPFYSGRSFNFVSEEVEYKFSDTSSKTAVVSGDITGSQIRFSEESGWEDEVKKFFFVPRFGLINKLVSSIKIYKTSKTSEKSYPHLFNNAAVSSYTEPLAGTIKVGGNGSGTAGSTSIGGTFTVADDTTVEFKPSSPVMYQRISTGFEADKFYLLDTEDLSDNTHDPETLYQKLVYNNKRYYPFLQDIGLDNSGTVQNYTLSIGESNKLHPPYIQPYVFGRSFAPLLENRLTNNKLDKIKLLKLSDSQWSEDTTIINTARYFSLINSSFLYYTILIKKKFNGQWDNWEIAEKQAKATPEKLTYSAEPTEEELSAVQASKMRIYDSTDVSSDVEDLRYMVATSSESHYTANYPHLVNVIEEKQPVLINGLEDERLYVVEGGDIHYAKYGGYYDSETNYGFERCDYTDDETNTPLSGPYLHHEFFYGKTDAWGPTNFSDKLETTSHVGAANDDAINFAVSGYGNFDQFLVDPSQADSAIFKVATCFDPWEIEADRVYTVTGHANDRIEYNGGIYKPDDLITGKHPTVPNSIINESVVRTIMSSTEYEVRKKSAIQPWMLSSEAPYSKEVGYKKLTPLLYKKIADGSIEANKKYILYKASYSTAQYNGVTYNVTDKVAAPDNEFRGTAERDWDSSGAPSLMQKFQDGLTIIPGVEYFVHGRGKITYPQSIVADGDHEAVNAGDIVAVSVLAVPTGIEDVQIFEFQNGAALVVGKWDVAAKTITGTLTADIKDGDSAPVITNHYSSKVITTTSEISPTVEAHVQHNLGVEPLPQDLFRGESLTFSGGGVFILSEGATTGSTNLKGMPHLRHISASETAKIVDFKEIKTKEVTASGNLTTGGTNTFKGLDGFSRIGGKVGELEILLASAGTANVTDGGQIKTGFLYKVFGQGTVTYNSVAYKGENIIYGVAGEASIIATNGSFSGEIWEIIDPYAVSVDDQVYAYGGTGNLFEYSDDGTTAYITNGSSRTWLDTDSGLKVHKIPYAYNAGGFAPNQPTICSSRIYGIEPGVTYTVDSTDLINASSKRRAVIKYVRDGGDCKMRDGISLATPAGFSSSRYNHRNDCLRRDVLTIDFDGPDSNELKQSWEDQKIEYGDYSTQGVDFRITTDELEHYPLVNGERKILSDGDSLTFSKGGRFILSADLKIDPDNYETEIIKGTEAEERRYYGTMYGTIPFGHYLYHHEHAPILSWQENIQDYYYTSDGTKYLTQESRVYVHNGEIKLGITYRVEEGVEIRYNGNNYVLGKTFTGANDNEGKLVDSWEYASTSNEFEYITTTEDNPTETEFVGVAGRPSIEVIEGNPRIFIKGEGLLTDGQYVVEGDDDLYYDRQYTADDSTILSSYYDTYKCNGWGATAKGQTSVTPVSTRFEDRAYVAGILVGEGEGSSFSVSSPKPLKNGAWVYDSENLGPILNVDTDFPMRSDGQGVIQYNVATGIAEAQDFVDVDADGDYAWSLLGAENETNYHLVTEGFLEFAFNKSSTEFPEVGANDLAYQETQESVLFNLSNGEGYDSFFKQGENFVTAVVFGAGEFSIHHWDMDIPVLHETTIYKAYGGFGGSPGAGNLEVAQGKTVTSIDEDFMYRVKDGSADLQYKDKLIIINNEAGYSSVDMDGNQVTFEDSENNRANFNYDSFDNDLYKLVQVERKGKTEGQFTAGDILVFESLITSLADTSIGAYDTNSANSAGISVLALPVNLQEGEVLFFETSESVTDVTDGEYYCVTDGAVSYGGKNYGPYHFSRVFKATNDGSISGSVVKASVLTLGEIAGESSEVLYGTVSQAGLKINAKCYREVAIKLTEALAPTDIGIAGKISDPLSLIDTGNSALKIRSLDNDQVISKGFSSSYLEKGVYSQYSQHNRFKGIEDATSWRGSGTVEYTNLIDQLEWNENTEKYETTDFFAAVASVANLCGEYTSGQPKVLYDLASADVFDNTGSPFRYYLYDLDYGSSNRGTLTINGKSTKGNNNFFIGDGSTTDVTVNNLKVTANNGGVIKSFVYVYRSVASGDIVKGRDYLVYGTGSIVYQGLEINSSLDYTETSFAGGVNPDYDENPYIRKSWNSSTTDPLLGTSIPINEAKFYVARPVVYEKIYAGDGDSFSIPSEAGVVYYVFGEGSVTYGLKEIFATNQYIAVASDMSATSNNKLISSGAISYGGRMIASAGDQYNVSENLGIISPISPVRGWTYAAIMQTVGKSEPTLDNTDDRRIYLYRKINGAETLEENKKYYVFGAFDYIFYKIGSKTYDYYPRGRGREDITVKGSEETDDALTINGTTITVPTAGNNFSTLSEHDEIWITWTVGGVVYRSPRTVGGSPTATSVTIDSTLPSAASTSTATTGWSGRVDGTTTAKTSTSGVFSSTASAGTGMERALMQARHALVRKGLGCCIRTKRRATPEILGSGLGPNIIRHKKYTYAKVFGGASTAKIPEGYSYIVRGRGAIYYPVFKLVSPINANYSMLDEMVLGQNYGCSDSSKTTEAACTGAGETWTRAIWRHSIYTKTYAGGQVFTAIEHPESISYQYEEIISDGLDAKYFWRTTGQEKIYRLPDNFKNREEKMNSMDQFIDIAPPKYGVKSGQLLDRHAYKVFYVDPYSGDVVGDKLSNYVEAGNDETTEDFFKGKGVKYGGKLYGVGESFRCFSQKYMTGQLWRQDYFWPWKWHKYGDQIAKAEEVNGDQRTIKEFVAGENFIVRPIYDEVTKTSGVWKRAPKGGWSNEWSMFLTSTHHHPSRTSTWHHDYYGDVMGFLNNRCHIFSEDFKLGMYKHLLQTFAYGKKPVIRSEAPPGYMYLEGSNADQSWFHSEVDSKKLNEWFYSSCQIYKPDYKVDAVIHKDYTEIEPSLFPSDGEPGEVTEWSRPVEGGICRNCGDREEEECAKLNVVECEDAGGTWIELRDQVIVRLDRRLTHTPNSAFNPYAYSGEKMSGIRNADLGKLHHAMGSGPFTAEVYRTDENSIVEYLIREKYKTEEDRPDFETSDGRRISGEPVQMQCNKAKIGDAAPDIFIWQLPDDPFGACEPRFYFTKRIPYVYDDNHDEGTQWIKTPVTVDPFIQMEMYLRGFCGGFIDKEADPQHDEINEVEDKYGNMTSLDPTCYKSKDYDYLFENLSIQALDEEGPDDENYKTVFVDHREIDINKDRTLLLERRVPMPKREVQEEVAKLGIKGWVIYRHDTDSKMQLTVDRGGFGGGKVNVTKAGTVKFNYNKVCIKNCEEFYPFVYTKIRIPETARTYAWIGDYSKEFTDRYYETLSDRETLNSNKTYYIVAVGKNMNQPLRQDGKVLVSKIKVGPDKLTVLKDSQSRAEITFTPSICSDPKFETKEECEQVFDITPEGTVPANVWMPVKYYTIERKRTLLPHYTEWKWYETAIDPVLEDYKQRQENKTRSPLRRLPKGFFQISDINLRTEEDEDPIYRGVSKDYEIEVMVYCKREGSGTCSDDLYLTKESCQKNPDNTWTSFTTSTSNEYDDFDQTIKIKVRIKGSKNPFAVNMRNTGLLGRTPYVFDEADGVFTIRFRNIADAAVVPTERSTKKHLSGLVRYGDGPFKGRVKLFYDLKYRVKYSYGLDNIAQTAKRKSEWEVIKKYKELENNKIKVFVDVKEYENQNVNYRVMKAQNRAGGVRWISPLMVVDKLTGYPDDRKGFGPLPNIKLRAYVFNQFANAINLLNEARLDLPIAIKYRYHILSVAKPNAVASQEGLSAFGYDLNEPAPTSGSYCVREFCRHAVNVGFPFDRYEKFTPSWSGHSVIDKWIDPEGESGTSDWYTSYGHTEFQADREYGYRRWPLMKSEVDAYVAIGGTRVDTELKVDGEQLSFRYAVPDILRPRTSSDSLVLSGRMDRFNSWTPTMRSAPRSYWATRDAGVPQRSCSCLIGSETIDESLKTAILFDQEECESIGAVWSCRDNWPAFCGYSDSTGFYSRPFSADGFHWMAGQQEGSDRDVDRQAANPTEPEEGGVSGLGAWVIFDEEETSKTWCEDIKGTFMLKAPKLHTSYGGLIVGHQMTGARSMNTCTFGGSQSRLVFTTRASTGDNNMRMKIPVKDKIGPWPHWSSVAEQYSGHVPDPPDEDEDTSKPEDNTP